MVEASLKVVEAYIYFHEKFKKCRGPKKKDID